MQSEGVASTSFTLGFWVLRRNEVAQEAVAVRGRNVYVVVATADWAKRPVPELLRAALARSAYGSPPGGTVTA